MARGCSEEKAFPDREIFVVQRKAEVDAFASSGLVRFVEDGEVERIAFLHPGGDDVRRLVSGEDKLHAVEFGGEKCADMNAVGGHRKIEIGRANDKLVALRLHGWIGADAEVREGLPRRFSRPLVQGLAQQGERRNKNE